MTEEEGQDKLQSKLDERQLETLEGLCSIQCTLEEIAAVLRMPLHKVKDLARHDPGFKKIWEQAPALGRASLRRLQLRHAKGFGPAAVAMTIHLSKHWLGETDRSIMEVEHNVNVRSEGDSAASLILRGANVDLLTKNEAIELAKLCDLVDEGGIDTLSPRRRARFFSLVDKAMPESAEMDEAESKPVLALPAPNKDETDASGS